MLTEKCLLELSSHIFKKNKVIHQSWRPNGDLFNNMYERNEPYLSISNLFLLLQFFLSVAQLEGDMSPYLWNSGEI